MMKKRVLTLGIFALLAISAFLFKPLFFDRQVETINSETPLQLDIDRLKLTQNSTYIALSSDNNTGYSRLIPFYFLFEADYDYTQEEITEMLNSSIEEVVLSFDEESAFFSASDLFWGVNHISECKYNVTLSVVPSIDELSINGIINVDSISFISNDKEYKYDFTNFTIDIKETAEMESFFYSSVSPIESYLNEVFEATVQYGIVADSDFSIKGLELYYPNGFAGLVSYEILETTLDDNGLELFTIHFRFISDVQSIVFRPFIKIYYDENEVGLIPVSLPMIIN